MAGHVAGGKPREVDITFYGPLSRTYRGHMTDSGVVAGLLGMNVDDPRIRTAYEEAKKQGLEVRIHPLPSSGKNPNAMDLDITTDEGKTSMESETVGGGEVLVSSIDGNPVGLRGKSETLLVFLDGSNVPEPLQELASRGVLSGGNGGALVVVPLEEPLEAGEMERITESETVRKVRLLPCLYDYGSAAGEPLFRTVKEMLGLVEKTGKRLPEVIEEYERSRSSLNRKDLRRKMAHLWDVMEESARKGLSGENAMVGGLMPGDDAKRMLDAFRQGKTLSGEVLPLAIARAISAMEVNASMGRVCAAPTAGSCGVLPGTLSTVAETLPADGETVIDGLLVSGIYGALIASKAPVSGAVGGCQSEIGVASAMAAAALVQIGGGTAEQTAEAVALALKNLLGLVCDPVAGPVEVPCIKRNAFGVANAFAAADMALAGIRSVIPPDEAVNALRNVQGLLPAELRGTMLGGLGSTETAERLKADWLEKCSRCPGGMVIQ
jgi:L-serine dehydratase